MLEFLLPLLQSLPPVPADAAVAEPVQGIFGLIAGGIGSLISGFGKKKAGDADAQRFEAEAQAADVNAEFLRKRTAQDLLLQDREATRSLGATRAAIGASGFTGGGSSADILRQSARDIAFDEESIRVAGDAAVEQEQLKAKGYRAAAGGARTSGKLGFLGGVVNAATTLLGG